MSYIKRFVFILLMLPGSAFAYHDITAFIGGGYSSNLFADSFSIGNSYLLNKVSLSTTNFANIRVRLYYDISYYKYDTGKLIDNIYHVPGIAIYHRNYNQRFRWGIEGCAAIKDYTNARSTFDNYRIFSNVDASYYFGSGLQAKGLYRMIRSKYTNYYELASFEHWAEGELVATLPTKTTVRTMAKYAVRQFDKNQITFHWIDTELGLSQSIDIRTGLSLILTRRWRGVGERPLSSYYVISGITSYWDPWKGNQIEVAIKRILPLAIVSRFESGYWKRQYSYDQIMQSQLWWLQNKSGRYDEGWSLNAEFTRQFNLRLPGLESLQLDFKGGYISNNSDDQFYIYNYFSGDFSLVFHVL